MGVLLGADIMEYLVECSTVQKSLVMGPVHLKEQTYAVLFMLLNTGCQSIIFHEDAFEEPAKKLWNAANRGWAQIAF